MSCVLRVDGAGFSIDRFVQRTNLRVLQVWRKGEARSPRYPGVDAVNETSGLTLEVTPPGMNGYEGQVTEATRFLKENRQELEWLLREPGVETVVLDLGVRSRPAMAAQSICLPAGLVKVAGELEVGISVTLYT